MGYLEGTGRAAHTIQNYRLDLLDLQKFLEAEMGAKSRKFENLTPKDIDAFHQHLKSRSLKTNTRRRKLLTIHHFMSYLHKRKQAPEELARKFATPLKVERIPFTVASEDLLSVVRALPSDPILAARNRALLWTLAETGALVSEVTKLRFENWQSGYLEILGKSARQIPVSPELFGAIQTLQIAAAGKSPHCFLGFNKFGSLGAPISSRGIELLVKAYGPKLGLGEITPRTFRHSAVLRWAREGLNREQIRGRLGLKTDYAFRGYDPLIQAEQARASR
ncbi:MAG: tyrosine-type recombinase/integrase [Bdellovibrionota bacterium]